MLPILESAKQEILDALQGFSSSFETWKVPWTKERAEKIDTTADVLGETADVGGTQTAGTVNAKLNAILQKQKVIRGLATFPIDKTSGLKNETINLPQTINPQYANISVSFISDINSTAGQRIIVTSVTSTKIDIRLMGVAAGNDYNVNVDWQVVGGVV